MDIASGALCLLVVLILFHVRTIESISSSFYRSEDVSNAEVRNLFGKFRTEIVGNAKEKNVSGVATERNHKNKTSLTQRFHHLNSGNDQLLITSRRTEVSTTLIDGHRSYERQELIGRSRRAVRPIKVLEVPETKRDFVLSVREGGVDYVERYSFKEPAPELLEINNVLGTVQLKGGAGVGGGGEGKERLDYETNKEMDFTVIITKVDSSSFYDEQPVKLIVLDVNDELPTFRNLPRPFLGTVSASAGPGTSVYQLIAEDRDGQSSLRYNLESGGEDRFTVDAETGVVRTRGLSPFLAGREYEIGVSVEDVGALWGGQNGAPWGTQSSPAGRGTGRQKSATESLKILVGERDPQFFESRYLATVPETSDKQYEVVQIKALSHRGLPISYELTTDGGIASNEFAIDPRSGVVDLLRKLDYERDPHQYHLKVRATENSRIPRTSTVNLVVNLIDQNDNAPTFPLSQYIIHGIVETVPIGTDIMQVTASDADSPTNAALTYSLTDSNFTVQTIDNVGYIRTSRRLDYEATADHTYNFTVIATDNGSPVVLRGSANVRVSVTNVNDESPQFTQRVEHVQVSEDAAPNTVIHVVQAYDPDGDDVAYSFTGDKQMSGPFSIDPSSGIVTLTRRLDKSLVSYRLNITATDNGHCCTPQTSTKLSSQGLVVVEVKDINNNAPRFATCTEYNPVVMEREHLGTFVVQVTAVDPDIGANGNITYFLIKSADQVADRFSIDPTTGRITTADVFDREAKIGVTDYGVTVKAEDNGSPQLAGFCTLRVKIGDKNDNPPVFTQSEYQASVEETSPVGRRIKQVYATDRDAGENSKVEYSIVNDTSGAGFFTVHIHNGWVSVAKPMSRSKVQLEIMARDRGVPPKSSTARMEIEITQTTNEYPRWVEDYSTTPIRLSENVQVNYEVKRLKATSSIPDSLLNYIIANGDSPEQNGHPISFYSRVDESTNEMVVMTYRPLDYEALPKYTLTVKAANRAANSLHTDMRLTVELNDENDEIPLFIGLDENGRYPGSIAENLRVGSEVITVTATDRDELPDFKKVTYRIKDVGDDYNKFTIDAQTGVIRTKMSFDRELKNEYYITVLAQDGAPSNRSNHYPPGTPNQGEAEVQIRVTDKNDNAPYFKELIYSARVPENTDIGTVVMSVTAEDRDEENGLTYSITGGHLGSVFEVVPDLGEIKVRGHLDYETGPREYRMKYRVFDERYANTTIVVIHVVDVNDNAPVFDSSIYNVVDVVEEERGISPTNPRYLLTVRATDPDVDRKSGLRYGLTGQFADDGTFTINERTGDVFLARPLDRDPPHGRPLWNFNVLAHDEVDSMLTQPSLTGYAEVRVLPRDINDNGPIFDLSRLVGKVPEHSRTGVAVLTVSAVDMDYGSNGSVTYSLKNVPIRNNEPLFSIDSHTGLVSTMQSDALDREQQAEYHVIVIAKDRGVPAMSATATVTIQIEDINDHSPLFTKSLYTATMSESLPAGASITSVSATDRDVGVNARLIYRLAEKDRASFTMDTVEATNTGVLRVHNPVDYDSLLDPSFNLTVYVEDTDSSHVDTAYIEIRVTDYNDNAPTFQPTQQRVQVYENVTVGTTLYRFTATDRDTGINKQFVYSIDRVTDPDRRFAINSYGLITTVKTLDRETKAEHRIHVLAIDKGVPALTGVATLFVTLIDVNDNAPVFAVNYRPVVYENQAAGVRVIEVSAVDHDTASNGPLFELSVPCMGACPCAENPACAFFSFRYVPGGGSNGHGSGVVTSLKRFDREQQKEYYLPIIMKDSGVPPSSGTSTLTIIIGDINDNQHYPGHKDIFVYNYKGLLENATVGNVYSEDEDDWDVNNKTFSLLSPVQFFRLNTSTGELSLNGRVPAGQYNLKVNIHDAVWRRDVTSTVSINVKDIPERAVLSSGSIRLHGLTAEQFVSVPKKSVVRPGDSAEQSPASSYDKLRALLARKLNIPLDNVDIFTVRDHPTTSRTIDVRYSAHGSPYYRPERLDGVVMSNTDELEQLLGVTVIHSPVDDCYTAEGAQFCENGCSNVLIINDIKPLVVNSNRTSLVGVLSHTEAKCGCGAADNDGSPPGVEEKGGSGRERCSVGKCLNGGTCQQELDDTQIHCLCPTGFTGPRCQQTHHSFQGDGSWAWYRGLDQCAVSHTSFELISSSTDNSLLLYHGPLATPRQVTNINRELTAGFMLLELRNGMPLLRVSSGSGELKLTIDGRDRQGQVRQTKLNDGRWHRIDIFKHERHYRLVVDRCESAKVTESENSQSSTQDRRCCEAAGETPGESRYPNISAPLQLGGRRIDDSSGEFPAAGITRLGFDGCIKNLIHNGELYDLHIGRVGSHNNTSDGCSREDVVCGKLHDPQSLVCGQDATCVGSFIPEQPPQCICKPGWRGNKCDIPTTTKDFRRHSFIEWDFTDSFYAELIRQPQRTDVSLMLRTRQSAALLLKVQNVQKSEHITLEIINGHLRVRYCLGGGGGGVGSNFGGLGLGVENEVMLSQVNISDGRWHTVRVERLGQWVTLTADSGEGKYFNETLGTVGSDGLLGHVELIVAQRGLFVGGDVRYPADGLPPLVDSDFENGCINDVRFNREWLPMDQSQNKESRGAEFVARSQNIEDGCESNWCPSPRASGVVLYGGPGGLMQCAPELVCVDLWRYAECRCPIGERLVSGPYLGQLCEPINECLEQAGLCHWGMCIDTPTGYQCQCQAGYGSEDCGEMWAHAGAAAASVSTAAWIIILMCGIVLILLLLLFAVYTCHRNKSRYDEIDADDDVRENMIHYDEEGVGEQDQSGYDINHLRKPADRPYTTGGPSPFRGHAPISEKLFIPTDARDMGDVPRKRGPLRRVDGPGTGDVEDFINDRLYDVDTDPSAPPHESVREYAYEGEGSTAGSLSSLAEGDTEGGAWDYLNAWGPRFNRLAQMYSEGEDEDDDDNGSRRRNV